MYNLDFAAALGRAQALAQTRLHGNGKDRDALFAMTLASGLQGGLCGAD